MIFGMLLFFIIYFIVPFKENLLFKRAGWLYLISHYQLFSIGVLCFVLSFVVLIRGIVFSIFFLDSNFFILGFLFFIAVLPYALDCIYYGLFNSSFFLEKFTHKGKNLMSLRRARFYSFIYKYVMGFYFIQGILFFLICYLFLPVVSAFFMWCLMYHKGLDFILPFIIRYDVMRLLSLLVFFFPSMLEAFSYAFYRKSFFIRYSDY